MNIEFYAENHFSLIKLKAFLYCLLMPSVTIKKSKSILALDFFFLKEICGNPLWKFTGSSPFPTALKFHIKCFFTRMLTFLVLSKFWKRLLNYFFDYFFLSNFSILFLEFLLFGCCISWTDNKKIRLSSPTRLFLSYFPFCLSFCFILGKCSHLYLPRFLQSCFFKFLLLHF